MDIMEMFLSTLETEDDAAIRSHDILCWMTTTNQAVPFTEWLRTSFAELAPPLRDFFAQLTVGEVTETLNDLHKYYHDQVKVVNPTMLFDPDYEGPHGGGDGDDKPQGIPGPDGTGGTGGHAPIPGV